MQSNPRVPGDRPLMTTGYKYIYHKVLGFIAAYRTIITVPGVTYLYRYPYDYSNVYICPVLCTHFMGSYFSACNAIDNHNIIRKYDIAQQKYWVTQSGYFRLATTVALVMGIKYGKLLLCHGAPDKSKEKKI